MGHYIDGKDCMVSYTHPDDNTNHGPAFLTSSLATDLRMDPFNLRLHIRCCAHLHQVVPSTPKA